MCFSFTLSPDDPNYEAYADIDDSPDSKILFYVRQAEIIKADESKTLKVDFQHMSSF